ALAGPAMDPSAAACLGRGSCPGSLPREGRRLTGVKGVEGQEGQRRLSVRQPRRATHEQVKHGRTYMRKLTRTPAIAAAATLALAGTAWAQAGERYHYGHHGMMGGWVGGMLMMLLMIALIVGAVILTL